MSSGYFDDNEQLPVLFVGRPSSKLQFYEEGVLPLCKSVCADGPLLAERLLGQSVLESGFQGYYSGKTQALLGRTVWGTVQQNRAGTDASLSAGGYIQQIDSVVVVKISDDYKVDKEFAPLIDLRELFQLIMDDINDS